MGYDDWRALRSPGRYVELRNPENLPEGFVARTYFDDARTVMSKEVLKDPELARKILREEAFHARRIRQIAPEMRGAHGFLYERSFLYHMREEAMAHAYAVRLPSGAGYGLQHAWDRVGLLNIETVSLAGAGVGTYAVWPDSQ